MMSARFAKDFMPIKLIVGLGNPGREYAGTRHNIGFMAVEALLAELPGEWEKQHRFESFIYRGRVRGEALEIQFPQTFMNASGTAVAPLVRRGELRPEQLLVVYDDMDLPLGRLRLRTGGSAGGHHGIESIIAELGGATGFNRLRIGIGHGASGIEHVLGGFDAAELELVKPMLKLATAAIGCALRCGMARAMNDYNHQSVGEAAGEEVNPAAVAAATQMEN